MKKSGFGAEDLSGSNDMVKQSMGKQKEANLDSRLRPILIPIGCTQ